MGWGALSWATNNERNNLQGATYVWLKCPFPNILSGKQYSRSSYFSSCLCWVSASAEKPTVGWRQQLLPPDLSDSISYVLRSHLEAFIHFIFWGEEMNANKKHTISPNLAIAAFSVQNLYGYSNRQKVITRCRWWAPFKDEVIPEVLPPKTNSPSNRGPSLKMIPLWREGFLVPT